MLYCAEYLGEKGIECAVYGFDNIFAKSRSTRCTSLESCMGNACAVILPTPLSKDGINVNGSNIPIKLCDVFSRIPKEVPVFAGAVTEKARVIAKQYDIEIYDYLEDENLAEKNALATAEGALYLMMRTGDKTIRDSACLVSGYGRIGKYISNILTSLGAKVTVLARRELSRTKARLDGCSTTDLENLPSIIGSFDYIINTVPARIFTERELSKMSSKQIYIELASDPYGTEKKTADRYNIEITDGSALPSKYCPASAGGYIAEKLLIEFEKGGLI